MSRPTETALELDVEAAGYTRGEAVHFGSFPGVWEPGRPVAVGELGFDTDEEALARVAELGLPLRKLRVPAGSAPMPERPNHVPAEAAEVVEDGAGEPAPEAQPTEENKEAGS